MNLCALIFSKKYVLIELTKLPQTTKDSWLKIGFRIFFRIQKNKRELRKIRPLIAAIREEESTLRTKRDLVYRTRELQARLARGETTNAMIVPAFATVAEAAQKLSKEEVYDVQIMGELVLHEGKIAEMAAGEGKTAHSHLACILERSNGQVHIATQNDYLTLRDFRPWVLFLIFWEFP